MVGGWDGRVSCKRQVHHSHYLHVNLLVRRDSVFPLFLFVVTGFVYICEHSTQAGDLLVHWDS